MTNSIVISQNVIRTIGKLPHEERKAIFEAFTSDEIFQTKREVELTPFQELIYAMVKDYIYRDSLKYERSQQGK